MGHDAPYMYQKPSTCTFSGPTDRSFNPKAATQASWTPRAPRPKPTGPLIDSAEMNRHPDSYFIVPYGNLDWKPMSPKTKTKVKWIRYFQLFLRICALLGAAGLLVCVICIRPTGTSTDWIIRIPPGIAILHLNYAIYHLSRSSKSRTPASSASYHIFASIMDVGLVPFLAFTALMAWRQRLMPTDLAEDAPDRWDTLFDTVPATEQVVRATYLISITAGGLHLASLCISIYLAVTFRKISNLPPDMNPLEDNLTKRSHKRNKSSLSTFTTTASPTTTTKRDSQLSDPLIDSPTSRAVPFIHTRNDSTPSFGAQQRRSNHAAGHARRDSRSDLPSQLYHPVSQQSSRTDLRRSPDRTPKRSSALALARSSPHVSTPEVARPPSSRPASSYVSAPTSQHDHDYDYDKHDRDQHQYQHNNSLGSESSGNWYVHASPTTSPGRERYGTPPLPFDEAPPEFQHLRLGQGAERRAGGGRSSPFPMLFSRDEKSRGGGYEAVVNDENEHVVEKEEQEEDGSKGGEVGGGGGAGPHSGYRYDFSRTPKPLEMNPPTPPVNGAANSKFRAARERFEGRALQDVAGNGGSPADRGVGGVNAYSGSPATREEQAYIPRKSFQEDRGVEGMYGQGVKGKKRFYGSLKDSLRVGRRKDRERVVSSGVDIDGDGLGASELRGREVSGKVAEEGRAY